MEEKKEKEESLTKQLYHFAGSYKYLSILSTILAAISAFVALVPFYYIWNDHLYGGSHVLSYRSIPCTGTDENSNDEPHHDITIRIY